MIQMQQRHDRQHEQLHHQQHARPTSTPFQRGSAHSPAGPSTHALAAGTPNEHASGTQCSRPAVWAALLLPLLIGSACAPDRQVVRPLAAGDDAPAFAVTALGGDTVRLRDLRGGPVLLNLWATWCPPCREEMPGLQALHETYGARGLRVVGVSIDSRGAESAIHGFLDDHGITFDILHDPTELVPRQYRTSGVPETFLIAPDGTIVHRWIGKFDPLAADVVARIEPLLTDRPPP
jgi:peroxiredoxin